MNGEKLVYILSLSALLLFVCVLIGVLSIDSYLSYKRCGLLKCVATEVHLIERSPCQ